MRSCPTIPSFNSHTFIRTKGSKDRVGKTKCVELSAPHRKNRTTPKTQCDKKSEGYKNRWIMEDFNARFQWARRALMRYEHKSINRFTYRSVTNTL